MNKHIIAAKNILFGTSYFVILALPEGWKITRSYLEPDVQSKVDQGSLTWVEAGQTDQIVFHPGKRIALDLMIRIQRGKKGALDMKGVQISAQGKSTIGGHEAHYCLGEIQQGLFRKKPAKTFRTFFYCPQLNRTVSIHFTGKCMETDLQEIFESLPFLECHSFPLPDCPQ